LLKYPVWGDVANSSLTPLMNSFLSPLSRLRFSFFKYILKTVAEINPMPMYINTIPCPNVYHGLSCPRYTFDETAPLIFPNEIVMAKVTDRLYDPSTLFETHATVLGMQG